MGVWTVPKAWQGTGVTSGARGDRGFCRAKELGVGTGGNGLHQEGTDRADTPLGFFLRILIPLQ